MFRKGRLASAIRKVETTDDDSDKEEAHSTPHTKKPISSGTSSGEQPKKPVVKASLSFGEADDEMDDGASFVKKPFQKMRQNVYTYEDLEPSSTAGTAPVAGGGAYSASELQSLRQNQQFASKSTAANDDGEIVGMDTEMNTELNKSIPSTVGGKTVQILELTGEEAAKYDDLPDFIPLSSSAVGTSSTASSSGHLKRKKVSFGPDDEDEVNMEDQLAGGQQQAQHIDDDDIRLLDQHRKRKRADPAAGRLHMANDSELKKSAQQNRSDVINFNEEDDDESRRWEEQLARRAGIKQTLTSSSAASVDTKQQSSRDVRGVNNAENDRTNINSITNINQVRATIKKSVDSLAAVVKNTESRRKQAERNVEQYTGDSLQLEGKIEKGMTTLVGLQDLKLHLADLVGMLRDTVAPLEELQSRYAQSMQTLRAKKQQRRLQAQDRELLRLQEVCSVCKCCAVFVIVVIIKYSFQAQAVIAMDDEAVLGNARIGLGVHAASTTSLQTVIQLAEAVMTPLFEQAAASMQVTATASSRDRGWWTVVEGSALKASDPHTASDDANEMLVHADLIDALDKLLEDCRPELRDMSVVLTKLRTFRRSLPGRYSVSFISLSLPSILAPLVLFDVTKIQFLHSTIDSKVGNGDESLLAARSWYQPILDYTLGAQEDLANSTDSANIGSSAGYDVTGNAESLNSDDNLLPALINTTLFGWFQTIVQHSFDCYSMEHSLQLKRWTLALIDFDISDDKISALLQLAVKQFEEEIAKCVLPTLHPQRVECYEFIANQLLKRVQLLNNVQLLKSLLTPKLFIKLVTDLVFVPKAIRAIFYLLSSNTEKVWTRFVYFLVSKLDLNSDSLACVCVCAVLLCSTAK
jgi:hypothetical protein